MNIFKNIFHKHLMTASPEKLADDLGPLKGLFNFQGFDHSKGMWLPASDKYNTLVNQSKTNIIRLISQQQSRWGNFTNPTSLKIAYMRFGNNAKNGAAGITKNCYYDLTEASARENIPTYVSGSAYAYPGGQQREVAAGDITLKDEVNSSISKVISKSAAVISDNVAIFTIKDDITYRPPANNTLVVDIYRNETLLERLNFVNVNNPITYTRSSAGFKPAQIDTYNKLYFVSSPQPSTTELAKEASPATPTSRTISSTSDTRTKLYYDYNAKAWKLMIDEWINPDRGEQYQYNKIKVSYKLGVDNVVNSIIPKIGVNAGNGANEILRYGGSQDYYSVLSNVEYRDADDGFIDDYSCTFAVNMGRTEGNGSLVSAADKIQYREAFLFNAANEMFSAIYLNTSMDKDPSISYYITWTIVAPI